MYNVGDGYKGTDGTIPSTSLYAWNLSLQNVRGKKNNQIVIPAKIFDAE